MPTGTELQNCFYFIPLCRITNKWIRWKAQEQSYPCSVKGWVRHPGLQEERWDRGMHNTDRRDRWRREFETFYNMFDYYDHLKSTSTELK